MYTKILVPLDGSPVAEQILPYARLVARAFKIPVELMEVIDIDALTPEVSPDKRRYLDTVVGEVIRNSEEYLKGIARTFPGIGVECIVEKGKPGEAIIEKAAADKATLVAMATHGRSGITRWLLGSVAEKVLRGGSNPLLLVRASGEGRSEGEAMLDIVTVPLDGSEIAERVLPHAAELAKRMQLGIVLLRTYDIKHTISTYEDLFPEWETLQADAKSEATIYLDGVVERLQAQGLSRVSKVVADEEAAQGIIELATGSANSLVAMCSHGRSGVKRWVLGSVTEKVVRHSSGPVLVIRAS